ncbi:hypothetical protein [Enorma sp.]|uniref:hypothetical protein n=1 Tax=Enorma sp. TaxID=1920692 RepID=UPI0025BE0A22|nr:hypothetical protein [Enorma sp.]
MIFDRNISRRSFTIGSIAAAGAGMAAISLTSCSSDNRPSTGEPQVVTDSSLMVNVLDGDYEYTDSTLASSEAWLLPLGTVLFHGGGCTWAAAMLTPESVSHINTLGVLSLASGNLSTVKEEPTQGTTYTYFDVRCSDTVMAWIEINYIDRSWVLFGQGLSNGTLTGSPVKLDEGDADWEPPRITAWQDSIIWQKMPLSTGSKSGESSHCYIWTLGSDEGVDIWESHGRFATTPRVSENLLTITPRVHEDEGVYYGLTALDLTTEGFDQVDQLVMPSRVSPLDAEYLNGTFAFSVEASYDGAGNLGNMGSYFGVAGGPFTYVRREPLSQITGNGSTYLVKSQSSHLIIDTEAQTYGALYSPDRSIQYGDFPATEGLSSQVLTFATVRSASGVPEGVQARVFQL